MEPVRGTEQTAWSRLAVWQSAVRPDHRALRRSGVHSSRRPVGSVIRSYRPAMSLGIEDRRRYRVGERNMTLENESDRQQ